MHGSGALSGHSVLLFAGGFLPTSVKVEQDDEVMDKPPGVVSVDESDTDENPKGGVDDNPIETVVGEAKDGAAAT